jgi:hypothetical protein
MDAREIEALSMLSRGFSELKDANAELVYNVILDVLCGINEYVPTITACPHTVSADESSFPATWPCGSTCRLPVDCSRTSGSSGRAR